MGDQAHGRHHVHDVFCDLSSRLVTLLPAVLLFNRTTYAIGFRQVFSGDNRAVWLAPGKSGTFWWQNSDSKRIQVAAKMLLENADTDSSERSSAAENYGPQSIWSPPFQLEENTIGSYP